MEVQPTQFVDIPCPVLQAIMAQAGLNMISSLRMACRTTKNAVDETIRTLHIKDIHIGWLMSDAGRAQVARLMQDLPCLQEIELVRTAVPKCNEAIPMIWDADFLKLLVYAFRDTSPPGRCLRKLDFLPKPASCRSCMWTLDTLRTISSIAPELQHLGLNLGLTVGPEPHSAFCAALPPRLQSLDLDTQARHTKIMDLHPLRALSSLTAVRLVLDVLAPPNQDVHEAPWDPVVSMLCCLFQSWPCLRRAMLFDLQGSLASPEGGRLFEYLPTTLEQLSVQATIHRTLAPKMRHLTSLALLSMFDVTIPLLLEIADLPKLQQLTVFGDLLMDPAGLQMLSTFCQQMEMGATKFPSLTCCVLRHATGTLVGVLGAIAPKVTSLCLEIDPLSMNQKQTLGKVVHFGSLKTLTLQGDLTAVDDALAQSLSTRLKSLEALAVLHSLGQDALHLDPHLTGPAMGPLGLHALSRLPRLQKIELRGCPCISQLPKEEMTSWLGDCGIRLIVDGETVFEGPCAALE
uniref:Uncharacterized protein n=2 Tax=Dunaliella tertiolecta TaxID=3047 RepID=A0A7S3QY08_DUNTE|eukprot:CAMPEP_0202396238 /NCGR_PEP_ID=MMETSP1127-20130417/94401_1 /ASSEMBLY_ACC=CAM_ASM_000462 /TAXON_ID=3047 /ORGANISM="Dunaliella tertiolecta, Strain CCMP1320" /LENGTH=516 /DNA_ID=CAMNT_0048999001 /DNA_START=90 /DNA_END=1640 /DNA_ORIENTATION=+